MISIVIDGIILSTKSQSDHSIPPFNCSENVYFYSPFKISHELLLSELKRGDKAIIDSFTDYEASLKLLEMGCIPGEHIEVIRIAPLGDPIAILVAGYLLSMRKDEAAVVKVRKY